MSKLKTFFKLLRSDRKAISRSVFLNLKNWRILRFMGDKAYIRFAYKCCVGEKLNLKNPITFSEKLQWLKLHDRKPEYTLMVDKYAVKDYVSTKIGEQYIIPTLAVWNTLDEIDFDCLPNKFVLKWNHDSGSIVICRDKRTLDKAQAINKLKRGAKKNGYWFGREWPYKNVKPCIIAEELLEDSNQPDLTDYKFYCFNGEPKYCQVIRDRSVAQTIDFYDMEWVRQPFTGLTPCPSGNIVEKPSKLDIMINICKSLSKDLAFSRIDLYLVNENVYFGEITFYPASGFGEFEPKEWNKIIGDLLILPSTSEK